VRFKSRKYVLRHDYHINPNLLIVVNSDLHSHYHIAYHNGFHRIIIFLVELTIMCLIQISDKYFYLTINWHRSTDSRFCIWSHKSIANKSHSWRFETATNGRKHNQRYMLARIISYMENNVTSIRHALPDCKRKMTSVVAKRM